MDNDIKAMLRSITKKLDNLSDKVQTLEDHHSAPAEPESPRPRPHDPALDSDFETTQPIPCHEPRRSYQRDHGYNPRIPQHPGPEYYPREPHHHDQDYIPRRPNPKIMSPDDQVIRNVRIDAPTFDGSLDPKIYNDWEGDME